ncbi:glycosyltransferase family 2 protein [Prosthecomicrobium hirschii]|uniref:glycosyltransferase family 2 protein n=1 Tax=Prosthecodimorpha hirschii TaxID=665126 RepID=UPI00221FCDEA|nr:glycosyltransferase family 2 protein [Prosthecomicrobium hirschii]MCW1843766.1 glycosyltransferase [Prosthecomicrobium hirschii]
MKFSIVTISFNQVDFLKRTIESVLSQTGVEVEYIVVDPGSIDGSRELVQSYGDRIAHAVFEKDEGPSDGLNRGFARATGEVFGYLNSDDTFEPGALASAVRFFKAHPKVDVVCGHAFATDAADNHLRRVWSEPFRPLFVAHGMAVQIQPSTFFRADLFRRVGGFNVNNRSNWDGELMVEFHLSGAEIAIGDEFWSCYRLHDASITNTDKADALIATWRKRCFEKLMGRPARPTDRVVGSALRLLKHVSNPKAAAERILRGPMRKRG